MSPPVTLNVYSLVQHPLRSTAHDHLYALRRHGRGTQLYLNLGVRRVPRWIRDARFDAVVFHTSFLSHRWAPGRFEVVLDAAEPLKGLGGVRVALPQDEHVRTAALRQFIQEFEIDHVFSLAAESEWPKIYAGVDRDRVGFSTVLPGYLSDETRERIDRIVERKPKREVDIGYRAWKGAPWLGRHGTLKYEVGARVKDAAPAHGLSTDISSSDADVLTGDDWFRFLASIKYTLGVEGGASLLDEDGLLQQRVDDYLAEHPDAGFDEIEAACFSGRDGEVSYFAIGPRHIEACATRTCQILIEGAYQGVLRAGEHYIPLRTDFSNLGEVLETVRRDDQRERITEAAYRDVIASGAYTYGQLVREIEEVTLAGAAEGEQREGRPGRFAAAWDRFADRASWWRVIYRIHVRPKILRVIPHWITPYLPVPLIPNVWRRLRGTSR